ncbi:T6SS phospholipase effector Tle1-like catalytic domain-containing protein [Flavobacterium sp.]|uniref:T6SS phospholipase effector Tle1-like catalytic domain-containing protein n=1 Tax=Flavobacterium sp. TaxID=239 RepID=UPI004048933A
MGTNISFGDYTPPPPPNGSVDIIVGIFFDGTSNNRYNIEGRRKDKGLKNSYISDKDGSNVSFGNDHSNVDRLQTIYPNEENNFSIYIEGIGTKEPKKNTDGSFDYFGDFTRGQGYGTGETGLKEKVRKGATDLFNRLKKVEKINSLTLDLFGFSRGAAAARMFANEIWKYNEREDDVVLQEIKKIPFKTPPPKRIKLRFIGLYDTVSSFNESNFSTDTVYDDQVKNKLLLKLDKPLGYVAHLTAENEYREMFPLTNCKSMTAGIELVLPGCHSDIGGGYNDNTNEEVVIEGPYTDYVKYDRDRMIAQGWYRPEEMKWSVGSSKIKGKREKLSNKYSYVILHLMVAIGTQKYKIPWGKTKMNKSYPFPSNLTEVKTRLWAYAFEGYSQPKYYTKETLDQEKKLIEQKRAKNVLTQKEIDSYNQKANDHNLLWNLRNKFLHFSASMDGIGMEPLREPKTKKMKENRYIIQG